MKNIPVLLGLALVLFAEVQNSAAQGIGFVSIASPRIGELHSFIRAARREQRRQDGFDRRRYF